MVLYPTYVRGEAYLAANQGREAALEFQKILDHHGLLLEGDSAKAKAAYQDFLTLLKDADPDIPILKQSKTEYAKLP